MHALSGRQRIQINVDTEVGGCYVIEVGVVGGRTRADCVDSSSDGNPQFIAAEAGDAVGEEQHRGRLLQLNLTVACATVILALLERLSQRRPFAVVNVVVSYLREGVVEEIQGYLSVLPRKVLVEEAQFVLHVPVLQRQRFVPDQRDLLGDRVKSLGCT